MSENLLAASDVMKEYAHRMKLEDDPAVEQLLLEMEADSTYEFEQSKTTASTREWYEIEANTDNNEPGLFGDGIPF